MLLGNSPRVLVEISSGNFRKFFGYLIIRNFSGTSQKQFGFFPKFFGPFFETPDSSLKIFRNLSETLWFQGIVFFSVNFRYFLQTFRVFLGNPSVSSRKLMNTSGKFLEQVKSMRGTKINTFLLNKWGSFALFRCFYTIVAELLCG